MSLVLKNREVTARRDLKTFLAWASIAYAFGFVTVMLHTARLGFPVLELLSAVHVWVGAPLAVICFFSMRIWRFFKLRVHHLTREVRATWVDLKQAVDARDFDAASEIVGFFCAIYPILSFLRQPFERLLRRTMATELNVANRAVQTIRQFGSVFRFIQSIMAFFRLFNLALLLVLSIYLYVWFIYPLIPQSFGGGAPTTVRLLVNTERIPPGLLGLLGIDADANGTTKTSVTGSIKLLYLTADQYYVEGPDEQRLSLSKSVVEGVIWNTTSGECNAECPQDLDGDGSVGAADLAIVLGSWGPREGCPMDFDGNGQVDALDLAMVLGNWGLCSA